MKYYLIELKIIYANLFLYNIIYIYRITLCEAQKNYVK